MTKHIFKSNRWFITVFAAAFLSIQSCNNNENTVTYDDGEKDKPGDSITTNPGNVPNTGSSKGAFNKIENTAEELERAERQKMISMQIDSTYAAISLLEEVKKEMTDESPANLTVTERNKKSKAIFNINIIQNELTRALDASILANLRLKTDELAGISRELEKNINHLQSVTEKLNKATLAIGRLTNILAFGLSKGWIKPATPKGASAAAVKSGIN